MKSTVAPYSPAVDRKRICLVTAGSGSWTREEASPPSLWAMTDGRLAAMRRPWKTAEVTLLNCILNVVGVSIMTEGCPKRVSRLKQRVSPARSEKTAGNEW